MNLKTTIPALGLVLIATTAAASHHKEGEKVMSKMDKVVPTTGQVAKHAAMAETDIKQAKSHADSKPVARAQDKEPAISPIPE